MVAMSRKSSIESHQATVKKLRDAFGRHPRPDLSTAYVEPQSPAEEAIAGVWSEALGLEQVGVHDNFFELGGNSLIGMEIIAEVRRGAGAAVPAPAHPLPGTDDRLARRGGPRGPGGGRGAGRGRANSSDPASPSDATCSRAEGRHD